MIAQKVNCGCCTSRMLSLFLTAIYPGEPGLAGFIGAKDDGSGGDNWSYKTCKTPSQKNHHHQQTSTHLFTGQIPFLSPNQQCWRCEGNCTSITLRCLIVDQPCGYNEPTQSDQWLSHEDEGNDQTSKDNDEVKDKTRKFKHKNNYLHGTS